MRAIILLALAGGCSDQKLGVYNTAPYVTIESPVDGESISPEAAIEFRGRATDDQDLPTDIAITWSSDVDGQLGSDPPDASGDVFLAVASLSPGPHAITLEGKDTQGETARTSVSIEVGFVEDNTGAPTAILVGPADGTSYLVGETVTFVGTATDAEQAWDGLQASLVSDADGTIWEGHPASDGTVDVSTDALSAGDHGVTLRVQDDDGNVATDDVNVVIVEDSRPEAVIIAPTATGTYWTDEAITFEGTVSDSETDTELLAVSWSTDLAGILATGNPDSSGYTATSQLLTAGTHVVTLTVVDGDAQEASDSVPITVIDPLDWDDDGDGWTENGGDCDDDESAVHPDHAELCDELDNDCDGTVNEDWYDPFEPNDSDATAYDLGEVDVDVGWSASQITLSGVTLHDDGDQDWFRWDADDEWYDNVEISVTVDGLPSAGDYVVALYLDVGGTWTLKKSGSGTTKIIVTYQGDLFSTDEDDWAVVLYAATWPPSSCATTYDIDIES